VLLQHFVFYLVVSVEIQLPDLIQTNTVVVILIFVIMPSAESVLHNMLMVIVATKQFILVVIANLSIV